jgi:hypothetical protein
MNSNTITEAIARSISHTEIVTVDLSDLAYGLRSQSVGAGDTDMADMCTVVIDVLTGDGTAAEYEDGAIAYPEARDAVVRCLIDCGGMDATGTDDVENDDEWEMWGIDADGDSYRVHIRLDR